MPRPYANTGKPIVDSWTIHENLAFNWKIHWKNASTDVLFELPPSHEATLPTRTPQTLQTLESCNFCHHKKAGKIASVSPFWPSQSWKLTLGGAPLSTSMRKKTWRRCQVQISQFFHQGLEQRPLGWIPQLRGGTRAQGGEDAAASSLEGHRI